MTVDGLATIHAGAANDATVDADASAVIDNAGKTSDDDAVGIAIAVGVVLVTAGAHADGTLTAGDLTVEATAPSSSDLHLQGRVRCGRWRHGRGGLVRGPRVLERGTRRAPNRLLDDAHEQRRHPERGLELQLDGAAWPDGDGGVGTDLGIGASFALAIVNESTKATIADGAVLLGADDLTMTATGTSALATEAKTGAKSKTAVAPAIAIAIHNVYVGATIGTGPRSS